MAEGETFDDNPKIQGYDSRIKSMAFKGRGGRLTTPRTWSHMPSAAGPVRAGQQKSKKRRGK